MKQFLVSRNDLSRINFVEGIKGKKIAIYNKPSALLNLFDYAIDMNQLMKDDFFLTSLSKCDKDTSLVLVDVLVKNGIYVHPYGRIFKFCECSKTNYIIDSFAFKWDERQIVRPFLFLDPSILGSSMISFQNDEKMGIDNYIDRVRPYIKCDVEPIDIKVVEYTPTALEKNAYDMHKKKIIMVDKLPKNKIVNDLIKMVDGFETKKKAVESNKDADLVIGSNNPRNKFKIYEALMNERIRSVMFFSSGTFGADEIELNKTKTALERHNYLISKL